LDYIFSYIESHMGRPKSQSLSDYEKSVLNRIKACKWDYISSSS